MLKFFQGIECNECMIIFSVKNGIYRYLLEIWDQHYFKTHLFCSKTPRDRERNICSKKNDILLRHREDLLVS